MGAGITIYPTEYLWINIYAVEGRCYTHGILRLIFPFSSPNQQASGDGGKAIHIGLTDEFTTALQGFFVDRSWGEVNVNCVQENERRQQSGLRDCYVSLRQHLHPRQQITSCESL